MFIIGLSGGIGCGKSGVTKYLRENHGVKVVDCDEISKNIYPKGSSTYQKIITHENFRNHVEFMTDETGEINRRKLGELVFKNDEQRKVLNSIVLPAIRWAILTQILQHFLKREKYVVIDAPTLFETKSLISQCRFTLCVYATEEQQLERILKRDSDLTESQVKNRIKSQIPIDEKVELAHFKIDNSGEMNAWEETVDKLVENWDNKEPRFGPEWKEAFSYVIITIAACAIAYYLF